MKRVISMSLVGAFVLGMGGMAFAGLRTTNTVVVVNTAASKYAYGSLGSARNSVDTLQYIGCTVYAGTATPTRVSCFARNAASPGVYLSCSSAAPDIVRVAASLTEGSY